MAIAISDMRLVYSGTTTNTPLASIGGPISTEANNEVKGQTATGVLNVTGVTVDDAYGNLEGVGTLSYTSTGAILYWLPPGAAFSAGLAVADGTYIIGNAAGYLIVTVVAASLPVASTQDTLTVNNITENIFDNVTGDESLLGNVEYRCFYVENNHGLDTAYNATIWVSGQPTASDTVAIALDPAGELGTAIVIADTQDSGGALSALTFTSPTTAATGIPLGALEAGNYYPVWVRRTTPVENRIKIDENIFSLGLYITAS